MLLDMLSLGADFVGGLMGQQSQKSMHKKQLAQAQSQFDSQMDESVTRRVADAKKAGIHPLFAMGASSGASPTISSGSEPRGQPMATAMSRMADTLAQAQARKDEALAMLANSQAAQIKQDMASQGRDVVSEADLVEGPAKFYAPEVPFSSSAGVRAGPVPEYIETVIPDGRKLKVINPDLNMDEVNQVKYVVDKMRLWTTDKMEAIADLVKANSRYGGMTMYRLEQELTAANRDTADGH